MKTSGHEQLTRETKQFAGLALLYFGFCGIAYAITRDSTNIALAWNIFLAWLPLLFGVLAILSPVRLHKSRRSKTLQVLFWLLLWLLFLPNAFYLFTDAIHLSELVFYHDKFYHVVEVTYVRDVPAWLTLMNVSVGSFFGLLTGVLSVFRMHEYFRPKMNRPAVAVSLLVIFFLCGFGIYVGRFLRFNSWSVVTHPVDIIVKTWQSLDSFAWEFTIATMITIGFTYAIFYVLFQKSALAKMK
jgi:uncharacterized membrane protein